MIHCGIIVKRRNSCQNHKYGQLTEDVLGQLDPDRNKVTRPGLMRADVLHGSGGFGVIREDEGCGIAPYLSSHHPYMPSPRIYRGLTELNYPFHDRDILVTDCGRICMHRKRVNLSKVFAGQTVGIKEVEDGVWLVSFMHYDLGYIDLEQKTLQPVDNPFGPGLSPMS